MRSEKSIEHLNKILNPVTGGGQLTVDDLIAVLETLPPHAKVFLYDANIDEDYKMKESDIYFNNYANEVYIGG